MFHDNTDIFIFHCTAARCNIRELDLGWVALWIMLLLLLEMTKLIHGEWEVPLNSVLFNGVLKLMFGWWLHFLWYFTHYFLHQSVRDISFLGGGGVAGSAFECFSGLMFLQSKCFKGAGRISALSHTGGAFSNSVRPTLFSVTAVSAFTCL